MYQVNGFDEQLLEQYLTEHIEGFSGPITLEKFKGGQSNPTYKVTTPNATYVLRKQPAGKLLKSAHAVDREYKVMAALAKTDVPVPKMHHLCEDTSIIGTIFVVMEYLEGQIHWNAALEKVSSNALRSKMYQQMNQVMANLHNVDIDSVGLADYGPKGGYFERQYSRWTKQYKASELEPIAAMDKLIAWLGENLPEDDGQVCLVHGDFRLDNMMFNEDGEIIGLLDWELSTLGHPYADLAYQCMQLRMPQNTGVMDGLAGMNRAALGIPTEAEYVQSYCDKRGIDGIDNWVFYLAFSFFRLAAIAQGVAKRAAMGNASSEQANKVAGFVYPLAKQALGIIESQQQTTC
ncbi:phosphotransferase family protein [Paraferrimonas sp. SM1919]|uniref:phosphotransferase family protein n=1 Tax=Paraferrimonas sp. SM1919 TaxID=2662263 RepID=UPI0013D50F45|nr:phosphotransferase family protein [Paraferrimonas sp. SM1919]